MRLSGIDSGLKNPRYRNSLNVLVRLEIAMKHWIPRHVIVDQRDSAMAECARLRAIPKDPDKIKKLDDENEALREQLSAMTKQRDEIWGCLKPRLIADGLHPVESNKLI